MFNEAEEVPLWASTFKFNLFRHYTEKNIYMIRNVLNIWFKVRIVLSDGYFQVQSHFKI